MASGRRAMKKNVMMILAVFTVVSLSLSTFAFAKDRKIVVDDEKKIMKIEKEQCK